MRHVCENSSAMSDELRMQRRCDELVRKHVIINVSVMVHELAKAMDESSPWFDELLEVCGPVLEHCGCDMDDDEKKEAEESGDELEPCGSCFSEIFEHWVVDGWLGEILEERGHVVREILGLTVWGRPTTGQMIALDGVVREIVEDNEMFEWIE